MPQKKLDLLQHSIYELSVLMSFALWAFDVLALWHCIKIAGQHPRNERQYSCPLGNASLLSAISQG